MQDNVKLTGLPTLTLRDASGAIKQILTVPNLVVNSGKQWLAGRAAGTPEVMTHMAIGTGNLTPGVSDVALGGELARVLLTSTSVTASTITYTCTFDAGVGTGALYEAGILNGQNVMLCRVTFGVVTKEVGDTLSISWDVTIN